MYFTMKKTGLLYLKSRQLKKKKNNFSPVHLCFRVLPQKTRKFFVLLLCVIGRFQTLLAITF